ncbi:molybdate transport system ATP-binding protein [Austwickia chelonae]|uniref:Molybdate ABC transporter ATP-binding protein n=1 Tax=Austwickia chelonae NBRC 105200 TaxID=1184607 RepID=K6VSS5_9MICO|nr:ABC transporter ATP-binding protein [Austwickia chelonae]GAB78395.1 molybdate ABC transporter ATP-binding protein [Austwickia chelonae NBRC 105200]SEW39195.1 molybdate transport system ATP-binding protein [Austwickia chelonae]
MTTPALAVHARLTDRDLHLDLDVRRGDTVAVVGPNGAGKTSLLRLVTGQLRPTTGTVHIDGDLVSGPERHLPTHRRQIALLDQRPLLFDHLDVLDNVAFGLRATGTRRAPARTRARAHLDKVGCAALADRRTWQISGGQAQRVALARALATEPRLLLLDEPMAALDITVAASTRSLLREILTDSERTALLVTHDVIDALALADRLVVVDEGHIAAEGKVTDLLTRPRTAFLADLVGVNLLHGIATGPDRIDLDGTSLTGMPTGHPLHVGRETLATIPPAAVGVHLVDPGGSPRNHLPAVVTGVEPRGALARVTAALPGGDMMSADLTAAAVVELDLRPGVPVRLVVKATQVCLYER